MFPTYGGRRHNRLLVQEIYLSFHSSFIINVSFQVTAVKRVTTSATLLMRNTNT